MKATFLNVLDLQFFAAKIKIAIDDGHGYLTLGKATPDGYHENYFNEKVVNYLKAELIRCGFDVLLVAPTTADTPLKARTDAANKWGADAYVSVHYNALAAKWRTGGGGIETFYYPNSATGKKLATFLQNELVKGTPLLNRGVKSGDLHVLRETNMVAALVECGFMDIKKEADLMKSAAYQKECAQEIARGICGYFKVPYKAEAKAAPAKPMVPKPVTKPSSEVYRVIADGKQIGAYSSDSNIIAHAKAALEAGADNIKLELVK